MRKKSSSKSFLILTACVTVWSSVIGQSWADPKAEFLYIETALAGGSWQYDYILYNTSDPNLDVGANLYDISLDFNAGATFHLISHPDEWEIYNQGDGFVQTASATQGIPPLGSDIGPGQLLAGFCFKFDYRAGNLDFEVTFENLSNQDNPAVYRGVTGPAPVPEPATLFLLCGGLLGLPYLRRKWF